MASYEEQLLEKKLMSQEAEIEQLARDNRKLASSHLALRQDLVVAEQEADKLKEHIRSIQTEGDIEIRILMDKMGKMEADIRVAENVKKELKEAHMEAQSLVTTRLELTARIQQAAKELESYRADVQQLPEMHAELDSLVQEHQRLRETFEYEKGLNTEKVEQMKRLEKDLIDRAEEVERLRAEVLKAEKRPSVQIPYNGANLYPPPFHGNGGYVSHLPSVGGGALVEGMNPYTYGGFVVAPSIANGPVANPSRGDLYDPMHPQS